MNYIYGLFDGAVALEILTQVAIGTWYHDINRFGIAVIIIVTSILIRTSFDFLLD
jgi:hypothetical protein